jgi:hypothetical protein
MMTTFKTKKRALVIGLNYTGTSSALQGCINDVKNVRRTLLDHMYFQDTDITVMTDDSSLTSATSAHWPTRANIEGALDAMVDEVTAENVDELWISYSGHGTNVKDTSGDERDGKDEALVPLDFLTAGFITDDQWRGYMSRIPASCRVVCFFDCCNSGTMGDLPYTYQYRKTPDTRQKGYRQRRRWSRRGYRLYWQVVWKVVKGKWTWYEDKTDTANDDADTANDDADTANDVVSTREIVCPMITISGCRDPQTSADAYDAASKMWCGALTTAFLEIVHGCTDRLTCVDLCKRLNTTMATKQFSQQPVVCSTAAITETTLFFQVRQPCCIR